MRVPSLKPIRKDLQPLIPGLLSSQALWTQLSSWLCSEVASRRSVSWGNLLNFRPACSAAGTQPGSLTSQGLWKRLWVLAQVEGCSLASLTARVASPLLRIETTLRLLPRSWTAGLSWKRLQVQVVFQQSCSCSQTFLWCLSGPSRSSSSSFRRQLLKRESRGIFFWRWRSSHAWSSDSFRAKLRRSSCTSPPKSDLSTFQLSW